MAQQKTLRDADAGGDGLFDFSERRRGVLELDDARAEFRERHGRGRAGENVGQFEDDEISVEHRGPVPLPCRGS